MEIIIQPSPEAACRYVAGRIASLLAAKPAAVLGLATGSTPVGVYRELIHLHQQGEADFSHAAAFNLDEYLGLPPEHPASYHHFMQENLFQHVNFNPGRTFIPSGLASDVPAACADYEAKIRAYHGIDLQILGIGSDGHIGFNEPSSSLSSRTRLKTLTPRTREDNARFFSSLEEVPHHVLTMGVGTIMEAREIFLLAFGTGKADAIAATVEGPVTANVPASVLQFHQTAKIVIDEAAASKLQRTDYYRWVFDHKPDWQR